MNDAPLHLDAVDRALIKATQAGLPLVPRPFELIAERVGLDEQAVMDRLERMQVAGAIRRIAAVPNHYALGYRANGMSVWDVDDQAVDRLGRKVGALAFVSHCYRRPRRLPDWRYNLFAMVHGQSRDEVEDQVGEIASLLGEAAQSHEVLYSTKILKKTGLRLVG
ncbi:MAG: AsnC family transcriptional regulator [Alphaproteobacteria bacterium]|nr:AsnC family transcriptional regulator [Alphaproteobacteria bacterium]